MVEKIVAKILLFLPLFLSRRVDVRHAWYTKQIAAKRKPRRMSENGGIAMGAIAKTDWVGKCSCVCGDFRDLLLLVMIDSGLGVCVLAGETSFKTVIYRIETKTLSHHNNKFKTPLFCERASE